MRLLLKVLTSAALTIGLLVSTLAVARWDEAANAVEPVYQVKVDHDAKTITVSVKLAFYVRPPLEANDRRRKPLNDAIARMKADIKKYWGNQHFLCYELKIAPAMRLVDSEAQVGQDEVGILLDPALVPILGDDGPVAAGGADVKVLTTNQYLSEDPADRADPLTGPPRDDPSTGRTKSDESRWPVNATSGLYSHELGHVLGLDDNYGTKDAGTSGYAPTKPGAADDMMRLQGQPIDPTTITRLVRRSGKVDESKMKCPMSVDMPTATLGFPGALGGTVSLHMWTCHLVAPSNAGPPPPPIEFTGDIPLSGAISSPFGSASGSGTLAATAKLPPGDPLFTVIKVNGSGRVEINQALVWTDGRPQAAYTNATLTKELVIDSRMVFSDGAKECK